MVLDAYGIDATVIHPPIAIDTSGPREPVSGIDEGFLLVVARLLGYKNVDLIVEAARRTGHPVVVVGDGPLRDELEAKQVPHVRFLGRVDDATLRWCYANCAAHVAMSYEDFGLSPIEAAGFGKPTIALGAGGYLDTVIDEQTGILVRAATVDALVDSLEHFATMRFSSDAIIAHATTFSKERFADAIGREVDDLRR
jgi:glycosyltransferase involved in cell wall biosynthesis